MSQITHILAAIEPGDPKATEPLRPPANLAEPTDGAEADRAAGPVETTPALSRNRPGAHVGG